MIVGETLTLFPDEVAAAVAVAARRRIECQRGRVKPTHFDDVGRERWGVEVESACAEVAVARALNLAWTGMSGVGKRDVGGIVEVRNSFHEDAHLIFYEEDEDAVPFVLVTGGDGCYTLRGWKTFETSRSAGSVTRRGESWWVPQSELRSIGELRRILIRDAAARLKRVEEASAS